jgi:flagellar hook-associated protein 3 FlgL
MRISTAFAYSMNTAAMQSKQADIVYTQQQIATNRRIVTPSDDPVGATHALESARALAISANNVENINKADVQLKVESTTLEAVRQVLNNAKNVAIGSGGNPSTQERTSFANYLTQIYQDLLGYANSTDSQGNYIFSGSKGSTVPFQQVAGASNYQGDNAQRNVAISSSRQIPVSDSGQSVFGVGTANDPFTVISQLITDLQNGALTGAALDTAASTAVTGISNAIDNVIKIHDQVAVRVQELQSAKDAEAQFSLQYNNELSRVENVDMQKAAVELQLQQVSLQATQQAFMNASKLSLFNYM